MENQQVVFLRRAYTFFSHAASTLTHFPSLVIKPTLTRATRAVWDKVRLAAWGDSFEILFIIAWAFFVGRNLLTFSPFLIPNGSELSHLIQSNFIWTNLLRCGSCFMWDGYINGGAPALAELSGAVLHPLVVFPTLLFGVIDGSKVTIVLSLALAGTAQWLLAKNLGLGLWPRMWSAILSVVGGHIAGKMIDGMYTTTLGHACAILILAFAVDLIFNHNRKSLVGLAVAIALTILSGEGYTQIAMAIILLPVFGVACFLGEPIHRRPVWKNYLLAIGLAILLSGIFLVPMAHFYPQVIKDGDPNLTNFPRLEYMPLNLVIRDVPFYITEILGKDNYPTSHILYIGWLPVVLAVYALKSAPQHLKRIVWIFVSAIILLFLITSQDVIKPLAADNPFLYDWRHFPIVTAMAVPFILALSAIGLDQGLKIKSFVFTFAREGKGVLSAPLLPVVLVPLSVLSIFPVYYFTQGFLGTHDVSGISWELVNLKTPWAEWIRVPGNVEWVPQAEMLGMKIGDTWRPWHWKDHPNIDPFKNTEFTADYTGLDTPFTKTAAFSYFYYPGREYAFVTQDSVGNMSACQSTSQGGWIDVSCSVTEPGILTVKEYFWSGWQVWIDGKPATLIPDIFLKVNALSGKHYYQFRYYPWDVPLGGVLTGIGIILAVVLTIRARRSG